MKAEKHTKEDIEKLKEWIAENNNTVYTVLRHVSKSGMLREISVVIPIYRDGKITQFVHPSYTIAGVLGWRYSEKNGHNAIVVSGAGMDMGFHLAECLSYALYGDGTKIKQGWI